MTAPAHRSPILLRAAAVIAVAGTVLAGCGSDDRSTAAQPVTTPSAAASVTVTPSASPSIAVSASAEAPGILKLGQTYRLNSGEYTADITVLKVRHGSDYEGVQVRTCNRGAQISVSRLPWTLGYDDFEQLHDVDVTGGGLPAPAYEDRDLNAGECAKGWVNYTSIPGERPDGIQYAPQDDAPVQWSFGGK